jgi:L-threonylcarbamoyladenylate synthase
MRTIRLGTAPEEISRAVEVLRDGGIVAFPTDTVYGIGAHGMLPQAVERLYAVKERPRDKAIPLLLPGLDALPTVAASVPKVAHTLAAHFWPGALTIVLCRSSLVPDAVTAGGDTVAVRVPDHPLTQALLRALAAPLAATSANRSGEPAPDTAAGVLDQLEGRIDLILDGGQCPGGVPSTVVDVTVDPPAVLRAGGIDPAALRRAMGL